MHTLSPALKKSMIGMISLLLPITSLIAAERIGDFALLDQNGAFHQLSWYGDHKAVVLLTQANGCEATRAAVPAYKSLQARFDAQGLEFMLINPEGANRELVQQEISALGLDMPVLMDDSQLVDERLGIEQTGDVIVIDLIYETSDSYITMSTVSDTEWVGF